MTVGAAYRAETKTEFGGGPVSGTHLMLLHQEFSAASSGCSGSSADKWI